MTSKQAWKALQSKASPLWYVRCFVYEWACKKASSYSNSMQNNLAARLFVQLSWRQIEASLVYHAACSHTSSGFSHSLVSCHALGSACYAAVVQSLLCCCGEPAMLLCFACYARSCDAHVLCCACYAVPAMLCLLCFEAYLAVAALSIDNRAAALWQQAVLRRRGARLNSAVTGGHTTCLTGIHLQATAMSIL